MQRLKALKAEGKEKRAAVSTSTTCSPTSSTPAAVPHLGLCALSSSRKQSRSSASVLSRCTPCSRHSTCHLALSCHHPPLTHLFVLLQASSPLGTTTTQGAVFDAAPAEDIYANPPTIMDTLQDQLQSDISDPALR